MDSETVQRLALLIRSRLDMTLADWLGLGLAVPVLVFLWIMWNDPASTPAMRVAGVLGTFLNLLVLGIRGFRFWRYLRHYRVVNLWCKQGHYRKVVRTYGPSCLSKEEKIRFKIKT